MTSLWPRIEPLLAQVTKPARYIGGELGAREPSHAEGRVAWLLVYPDTYEIGLPNQGLQILYEILNDRDDVVAERAYAPWTDMERAMRDSGVPFFSLENALPASGFDVIAFNLSAELTYTNVLNLIDLSGLPVRSAERDEDAPLVIAGGHCAFNPEPLADFIDAFVLGDGEEVVGEITEVIAASKRDGGNSRPGLLAALARVPGTYVPALYEARYEEGHLAEVAPFFDGVPRVVEKRVVADLAKWPYPRRQLVPLIEVVHDRLNVEIFRGCTRGCRFCQAGMITRPVRERPTEQVDEMIRTGLARTGYDEVALTSLSSADFSGIETAVSSVINDPECSGQVSVSLPSLRVDAFTVGLAAEIQKVRRTGLTFAPEGGTWRMRQVINKLISEEDLYSAVDSAFAQGWRRVKLYFLIGLPTETDEDVLGIAALARRCAEIGQRHHRNVTVTASVGGFVPKPQTPFQWFGQDTADDLRRKIRLLRDDLRGARGVSLRWHDPEASVAEGIVSRGDRRVGAVVEHVWRAGGTFQEWSEHFDLGLWTAGLDAAGLTLDELVHRHRPEDEVMAWDHISASLHRDFLWQDFREALDEHGLEDCRWTPCYDCGACTGLGVEHVVASTVPPAGGSQGTGQDLTRAGSVPVTFRSAEAPREARGAPGSLRGRGRHEVIVRLRFSKLGRIRWTSQRERRVDLERALRRGRVPVSYTSGFSPRPKLSFGLALPTGCESMAEYLDVTLDCEEDPGAVAAVLQPLLPDGIEVTSSVALDAGHGSLQEEVSSCSWHISVPGRSSAELRETVSRLRDRPSLVIERERKGRATTDDVRPSILLMEVVEQAGPITDTHLQQKPDATSETGAQLVTELATRPCGVRPAELASVMGENFGLIRRTHQWIERDGSKFEPLDLRAATCAGAKAGVS